MKTGIIVLGMGRSGTSLVTDVIRRWGAFAGLDGQFDQADHRNPRGYWEYKPLRQFNSQLLASVDASEVYPPIDDSLVRARASEPVYRDRALQLIAEMEAGGPIWVWKDPMFFGILPFWQRLWKNVVYVIPVRNPLDVVASQQKWLGEGIDRTIPESALLLYWQNGVMTMLRHTEAIADKIFISYEHLVESPQEQCQRLCAFLDGQCGLRDHADQRIVSMVEAIDQQLWRNRNDHMTVKDAQITAEQISLYHFLQKKIDHPMAPFDAHEYYLYPHWRDYFRSAYTLIELSKKAKPSAAVSAQ